MTFHPHFELFLYLCHTCLVTPSEQKRDSKDPLSLTTMGARIVAIHSSGSGKEREALEVKLLAQHCFNQRSEAGFAFRLLMTKSPSFVL